MLKEVSEILEGLLIKTRGPFYWVQISESLKFLPYYPAIKADLDEILPDNIEEIVFFFYENSTYSIEIQLEDINLSTLRPVIR